MAEAGSRGGDHGLDPDGGPRHRYPARRGGAATRARSPRSADWTVIGAGLARQQPARPSAAGAVRAAGRSGQLGVLRQHAGRARRPATCRTPGRRRRRAADGSTQDAGAHGDGRPCAARRRGRQPGDPPQHLAVQQAHRRSSAESCWSSVTGCCAPTQHACPGPPVPGPRHGAARRRQRRRADGRRAADHPLAPGPGLGGSPRLPGRPPGGDLPARARARAQPAGRVPQGGDPRLRRAARRRSRSGPSRASRPCRSLRTGPISARPG